MTTKQIPRVYSDELARAIMQTSVQDLHKLKRVNRKQYIRALKRIRPSVLIIGGITSR
jgi:hypothetical protein